MAFLLTGDQLDGTFAFANRILLIPEYGIDHTECAKRSRIVGLVAYRLSEFVSRAVQRPRELLTHHHAPKRQDPRTSR